MNLLALPPGAWSSQRHWHPMEEEFVHVLEGEVVLVTDVFYPGIDLRVLKGDAGYAHQDGRPYPRK